MFCYLLIYILYNEHSYRVHPCNSNINCDPPYLPPTHANELTCENRLFSMSTRVQVTRYGDAEQIEKSITFFSESELNGDQRSYVVEQTDIGDIDYGSYYWTGVHSWTIFEGSNYDGVSKCLMPSAEVIDRGYVIFKGKDMRSRGTELINTCIYLKVRDKLCVQ